MNIIDLAYQGVWRREKKFQAEREAWKKKVLDVFRIQPVIQCAWGLGYSEQ